MAKGNTKSKEQKPIEQTLWDAANKLRGKVEPAEYKHVVLSMIFLKYANDRFSEHREQMIANGQEAFLEMMPFYQKDNVFYIPECARWDFIMKNAKQPDIAIKIDTALHEIEMKNPSLEGALPDNYYSRLHMDPSGLSSLLDLINGIDLQVGGDKDVFGKVYEYCLRQFALKEGKGKGEFYTPRTVVALLCELIEPYSGIVYDGACGSGGMFVQSMRFVDEHKGNRLEVSIYGQELTDTTRRLAKMNLAIRGISANLGAEAANTFLNDQHKDLKADFSLENPPFNQKDWREPNQLTDDPRWNGYPTPPTSNANYGWLLNTLSKLSQNGVGVVLLANGALSADGEEYEIRKQMIENDVVESIIVLPRNMFYTTNISVTIWVLNKNKKSRIENRPDGTVSYRDRSNEVLFMDLRQMGHPYEKRYIEFNEEDRATIVECFKSWRFEKHNNSYKDIPFFCRSVSKDIIAQKDYNLSPSKYIELVHLHQKDGFEYKRLGDYISEIDNRNSKSEVTNLLGVSIEKRFMPSVANIIGTDLTTYKIISKNQFACSLMQVSRDGGVALALYKQREPSIMSPAYYLFEVTNKEIFPEYLELVLMGQEFDRDASFYAIGGVRGTLTWQEFCDIEIPVPDKPVQQELILNKRIFSLKNELSDLLESTELSKNELKSKLSSVIDSI